MSKFNILFKLSGSIAAYKSAHLISKLAQEGFEVQAVVSESALNFIGEATLEGLTGKPVYKDSFEPGKMMSHINLIKWADLILLAPASANTINKFSAGIGDSLVTSLFLAFDFSKPYLIAPAMNTNMFGHPTTKASLKKLAEWGIEILPTDEGYLACGDYGRGKLLDPDKIYEYVVKSLQKRQQKRSKNILITSGGTSENIDGIRYLTNLSTGKTGTAIAQYFINKNYKVTFIGANNSKFPDGLYKQINYSSFDELNEALKNSLKTESYDLIIHLAAVSDYRAVRLESETKNINLPSKEKIASDSETMMISFKKNFKIINRLKDYSLNKDAKIISFKFTNTKDEKEKLHQIKKLFSESKSTLIVLNDFGDRKGGTQKDFRLFKADREIIKVNEVNKLAEQLEEIIFT